jgi:hypothetical protein
MSQSPDNRSAEPGQLPVSVILERRPAVSQWVDHVWTAAGVTVGQHTDNRVPELLRDDHSVSLYRVGGLHVSLHTDECESYYYNLVSDTPRAYVVARTGEDDGRPEPFLVSMSFDEAHAYLEGDDDIYAVDIPGELYRWTEAYVIANYFPEKKRKRKRRDWSADESSEAPR